MSISENMKSLADNIYNKLKRRDERKLKIWKYAGLMLTYKCSAACQFCYYNCSPDSQGLMPVDTAIAAWQSLEYLAGDKALVHITGGEPFLYFDHLCAIMAKARQMGLTPPDAIETNASWATNRNLITERIKALDELGMTRLKISWDPFHAEFIDPSRVKLLASTATDILGKDRVLVRWEKYLQQPVKISEVSDDIKKEIFISAADDDPCRFTGRAAHTLGHLFADKSIEQLSRKKCIQSYLGAKGVHIDPYGNVFSGLCSGIILGNVNDASLADIWRKFDPDKCELISSLCTGGPAGLIESAISNGYRPKKTYAGKCHLCTDIRQFFFDNEIFKPIIGPADCYQQSTG